MKEKIFKLFLISKAIINRIFCSIINSPLNYYGAVFLKHYKIGGLRKEKKYGRQQSDFTG